jgi:hypothetical protein
MGAEKVLKAFIRGEGCRDDEVECVADEADADGNAEVALLVEAEESAVVMGCCGGGALVVFVPLIILALLLSTTPFAGGATLI